MAVRSNPRNSIDWLEIRKRLAAAVEETHDASSPSPDRVRQILEERASALAAPPRTEADEGFALEIITFELSGGTYALEIEYVREVVVLRNLSPVPRMPGYVMGILEVRGQLLPVFDLRPLLGIQVLGSPATPHAIICGQEQSEFGIFIDNPGNVQRLSQEATAPLPGTGRNLPSWLRGSIDQLLLLDGAALLKDSRLFLT